MVILTRLLFMTQYRDSTVTALLYVQPVGGSPPPKMKSKILRHWQHRRPHGLHRSPFHRSLVPALWAAGTGKGLLSHIPPSRGGWCRSPSGCCHPEKWRERSWEKGQKPKRYSHKEGRLWGGYTLYLSQQSNGHYITANIHNNPLWKWVNHKHTAEGKWLLRRIMYLLPCFRLVAAPSEADELKHPPKANTATADSSVRTGIGRWSEALSKSNLSFFKRDIAGGVLHYSERKRRSCFSCD